MKSASTSNATPPNLAHYGVVELPTGLLFLPGQGCRDPETNLCVGVVRRADGTIESYDIEAQARGVFRNVEALLLAAGLSRNHIVDVTVFMKNKADFQAMNRVWDEYFRGRPAPPARTTVFVLDLPGENFIEMKALASRTSGTSAAS